MSKIYRTKKGTFKPTRLDRIGVKPNLKVGEDHPERGYDAKGEVNKQSVMIEERIINGRKLVRVSVYEYSIRGENAKPWVRTEHRFNSGEDHRGMDMVKLVVHINPHLNDGEKNVDWSLPSRGVDTNLAVDIAYLLNWASDCADMEEAEACEWKSLHRVA